MKDLQVACIVCGEYITWDDSPLPPACATHTYQDVCEAYDEAACAQSDVCPVTKKEHNWWQDQGMDFAQCWDCGKLR